MKPNEKAGMYVVIVFILCIGFFCFLYGLSVGQWKGCKGEGCYYENYKTSPESAIMSGKYLEEEYYNYDNETNEPNLLGDLYKIGGKEYEKG